MVSVYNTVTGKGMIESWQEGADQMTMESENWGGYVNGKSISFAELQSHSSSHAKDGMLNI